MSLGWPGSPRGPAFGLSELRDFLIERFLGFAVATERPLAAIGGEYERPDLCVLWSVADEGKHGRRERRRMVELALHPRSGDARRFAFIAVLMPALDFRPRKP